MFEQITGRAKSKEQTEKDSRRKPEPVIELRSPVMRTKFRRCHVVCAMATSMPSPAPVSPAAQMMMTQAVKMANGKGRQQPGEAETQREQV